MKSTVQSEVESGVPSLVGEKKKLPVCYLKGHREFMLLLEKKMWKVEKKEEKMCETFWREEKCEGEIL